MSKIEKLTTEIQDLKRKDQARATEEVISGTTSASGNTQMLFYHKLKRKPTRWFPVSGDVYVKDMTASAVDVRSTQTNQPFQIIVS
jgi:hypothetical protein